MGIPWVAHRERMGWACRGVLVEARGPISGPWGEDYGWTMSTKWVACEYPMGILWAAHVYEGYPMGIP